MGWAERAWLALAAVNGLLAVAAGAFGAHGVHDPEVKEWLRTGAQYELAHAVAAFAATGALHAAAGPAAWLFGAGGLLFGGSLYLMGLTGVRALGAVTPVGGLLMILGWAALGLALARQP